MSEELVRRFQAGDAAAFRQLFVAHRSEVARLVQRLLGHSNDLEDVVQEVFIQVHRSLRDFRAEARFSTWLYRVTVNVVLMHRRSARSRPKLALTPEDPVVTDPGERPDDATARRARFAALERALAKLSEKKRTVFVLHALEGLPFAEIGKILDAPVLTMRTRYFYARQELESALQEEPTLAEVLGAESANDHAGEAAPRGERSDERPATR